MPQLPQAHVIQRPGESGPGGVAEAFGLAAAPGQEEAFEAGVREIEDAEREAEKLARRLNRLR